MVLFKFFQSILNFTCTSFLKNGRNFGKYTVTFHIDLPSANGDDYSETPMGHWFCLGSV